MYLSTAGTVLGLVLAILLSAALVLGLVLDRQSTWTWQVLSQVLFSINIWFYLKNWKNGYFEDDRVFTVICLSMLCLSMNSEGLHVDWFICIRGRSILPMYLTHPWSTAILTRGMLSMLGTNLHSIGTVSKMSCIQTNNSKHHLQECSTYQ